MIIAVVCRFYEKYINNLDHDKVKRNKPRPTHAHRFARIFPLGISDYLSLPIRSIK